MNSRKRKSYCENKIKSISDMYSVSSLKLRLSRKVDRMNLFFIMSIVAILRIKMLMVLLWLLLLLLQRSTLLNWARQELGLSMFDWTPILSEYGIRWNEKSTRWSIRQRLQIGVLTLVTPSARLNSFLCVHILQVRLFIGLLSWSLRRDRSSDGDSSWSMRKEPTVKLRWNRLRRWLVRRVLLLQLLLHQLPSFVELDQ